MFNYRVYLSIFSLLFAFSVYGEFSFNNGAEGWAFYGQGVGVHDQKVGRKADGSLYLSTQFGDEKTAHLYVSNLKPGTYRFTAWFKLLEVAEAKKGEDSFWHFYDNGSGIKSLFRNLSGSTEWSRVKHEIQVTKKGSLDIWFRLKVPGQVWIDDISLDPVLKSSGGEQVFRRIPLKKESFLKQLKREKQKSGSLARNIDLFSFEKSQEDLETGHPFGKFETKFKTDGLRSAVLSQGEYYNFDFSQMKLKDWSAFDYIELDIYSPLKASIPFYLVLGDKDSKDYWTKLNHKTRLTPGWNKLTFKLKRWVGERGSVKVKRYLDLKNLKQFFVIVDPDNEKPTTKKFFIDKVKLYSEATPTPPKEVRAFDFTNHFDNAMAGFTPVTTQTQFRTERGFGFIEPKFWRLLDSVYVDKLHRHSIGIKEGNFRVSLPNGRYRIELVMDQLGYWDVPFWSNRMLYVAGKPVFKETRSFAKDYLRDYLRFEEVEPESGENPYDTHLKSLFKPIVLDVFVEKGHLDIGFEGDASGISLNSLLIYKIKDAPIAKKFKEELTNYNRKEYLKLTRSIEPRRLGKKVLRKKEVSLIRLNPHLEPTDYFEGVKSSIKRIAFKEMRLREMLQLHGVNSEVSFKVGISKLKNKKGEELDLSNLRILRLVNTFVSENLNHETYLLAGKFFKPMKDRLIRVPSGESRFLMIDLPISNDQSPGTYRGFLKLVKGKDVESIEVEIQVKNKTLPEVKLPVGFLGLDPIGKTYFKGRDFDKLRWFYREQVIKELGLRGFTSFSSLPKVPLVKEGDQSFLDYKPLERLFVMAKKAGVTGPYFSYGGEFPEDYFEELDHEDPEEREKAHRKHSAQFKTGLIEFDSKNIIYTFSDEAHGYSDKVKADLEKANFIKSFYPELLIGGFSTLGKGELEKLNNSFDYGFYAYLNPSVKKNKKKWGTYNGTPRALDDPRHGFGPALFSTSKEGLSYYLDWHMAAYNNYPYFDLDGRESEVAMFYPKSDGSLLTTLKFELSAEGLQDYRLLLLLERSLKRKSAKNKLYFEETKKWISKLLKLYSIDRSKEPFSHKTRKDYSLFKSKLLKHLEHNF